MMVDNKPVAACFLYISNSLISHLEWLISDRNYKVNVKPLIDEIIEMAKVNGSSIIMTSFDNNQKNSPLLRHLYESSGFDLVGSNVSMMVFSEDKEKIKPFICE